MIIVVPEGKSDEVRPIEFLEELYNHNPFIPMETITAVVWGIWKKRCEMMHNPLKSRTSKFDIPLSSVK